MKLPLAHALGLVGVLLCGWGTVQGLFVAPPDRFMGDVMRILYVHVPTAWNGLLCLTYAFVFALASLFTRKPSWDWWMEAAMEVGLVQGFLLTVQGSIWARPTWGVWWDWDPRLTSVAVLVVTFSGVMALRSFVDDAEQRARWSAVATVLAYVNVPIVYMSVKWWRTLHQMQSSAQTVDKSMVGPLMVNFFGLLLVSLWLIRWRFELARAVHTPELAPPPEPA